MTDKQLGNILNNLTIIIDSREQKNQHIIDYLKSNNIKYVIEKLDHGDYSYYLDGEYSHLSKKICIEKKNSLSEIAGNFTSGRERFHREFQRAEDNGTIFHLVVENATWKKIVNGSYRSQLSSNSMTASLLDFNARYATNIWFVGKDESPMLIYKIIWYGARNLLKSQN